MPSSPDEGEIRDDCPGELKASLQHSRTENGVDRRGRNRDSTPLRDSVSRASGSSRRSRSPRGSKRSRDDGDHYGAGRDHDSRQPRARHDDRPQNGYHASARHRDSRSFDNIYDDAPRDDYRRSQVSYEDLDQPPSRASSNQYDSRYDLDHRPRDRDRRDRGRDWTRNRDHGRDWGRDKRTDHRGRDSYTHESSRRRSRSPDRSRRDARAGTVRFVQEGRHGGRQSSTALQQDRVPKETQTGGPWRESVAGNGKTHGAAETSSAPPEPEDYELPQPIDEDAEIERRRKRREELLAKSSSATPLHAVGTAAEKAAASVASPSARPETHRSSAEVGTHSPGSDKPGGPSRKTPAASDVAEMASSRDEPSSPADGDMLDVRGLMNMHGNAVADEQDGPSAADYDPTVDMEEDERRDERRHGQTVVHGEPQPVEQQTEAEGADDQETEDDFDMFAEEFDEAKYAAYRQKRGKTLDAGGMLEDDDTEGFYKIRIGEVVNGRYELQTQLGQGMFSRVVRAKDTVTQRVVAIKMMRNNYALRRGGYTEIAILQKLNEDDPSNKNHIVRFEQSFNHRGHLCMVFEGLEMNLREVLRKFGKNVGINLEATRKFAKQIFMALKHLRKNKIIHADLKPDNILINETRQVVKVCDLGTAIDRDDAATAHSEVTPYLISRFYRAPEVILGMDYDYSVDMWSIGCTLFELFTGKILFPGESNNQMLKVIMEARGRMYPRYYKRGQLWQLYFDEKGEFASMERDPVTNKVMLMPPDLLCARRPVASRRRGGHLHLRLHLHPGSPAMGCKRCARGRTRANTLRCPSGKWLSQRRTAGQGVGLMAAGCAPPSASFRVGIHCWSEPWRHYWPTRMTSVALSARRCPAERRCFRRLTKVRQIGSQENHDGQAEAQPWLAPGGRGGRDDGAGEAGPGPLSRPARELPDAASGAADGAGPGAAARLLQEESNPTVGQCG